LIGSKLFGLNMSIEIVVVFLFLVGFVCVFFVFFGVVGLVVCVFWGCVVGGVVLLFVLLVWWLVVCLGGWLLCVVWVVLWVVFFCGGLGF
jgi:hypothetical protein